jgi:integrase
MDATAVPDNTLPASDPAAPEEDQHHHLVAKGPLVYNIDEHESASPAVVAHMLRSAFASFTFPCVPSHFVERLSAASSVVLGGANFIYTAVVCFSQAVGIRLADVITSPRRTLELILAHAHADRDETIVLGEFFNVHDPRRETRCTRGPGRRRAVAAAAYLDHGHVRGGDYGNVVAIVPGRSKALTRVLDGDQVLELENCRTRLSMYEAACTAVLSIARPTEVVFVAVEDIPFRKQRVDVGFSERRVVEKAFADEGDLLPPLNPESTASANTIPAAGLSGDGRLADPPADTKCCCCQHVRDQHAGDGKGDRPYISRCATSGCSGIAFGSCGRSSRGSRVEFYCTECISAATSGRTAEMRQRSRESRQISQRLQELVETESEARAEFWNDELRERRSLHESASSGLTSLSAVQAQRDASVVSTPGVAAPTVLSAPARAMIATNTPSVASASPPTGDPVALAAFNNATENRPASNFVGAPPAAAPAAAVMEYEQADFLPSQGFAPPLAPIPSAGLFARATIFCLETLRARSSLAFSALSEAVRKQHLRWLHVLQEFVRNRPAAGRTLEEMAALCMHEEGSRRHWQWQTLHRSMASLVGALNNVQLYTDLPHAISLNFNAPYFRATMAAVKLLGEQSKPHGQVAVTSELLETAVENESRLWIRVALVLMWVLSARVGDVLQLRIADVVLDASSLRITVTFRHGKGVLLRGPYSVHAALSPEWMAELAQLLGQRCQQVAHANGDVREALLFPATPDTALQRRTARLLASLRVAHPSLNLRAMRRGSLQTVMQGGATLAEAQHRAGHMSSRTTEVYLDQGRLNLEAARRADIVTGPLLPSLH